MAAVPGDPGVTAARLNRQPPAADPNEPSAGHPPPAAHPRLPKRFQPEPRRMPAANPCRRRRHLLATGV